MGVQKRCVQKGCELMGVQKGRSGWRGLEAVLEAVEEGVEGFDVVVGPCREDGAGRRREALGGVVVGGFTGRGEAVVPAAVVVGIPPRLNEALGDEPLEDFRDGRLARFQGPSQGGYGPGLAGQTREMIQDDKLGVGQRAALEGMIHPGTESPGGGAEPDEDLTGPSLGYIICHGINVIFYGM